jgi:uncharacterized protein YbaA (DUF1428 family)
VPFVEGFVFVLDPWDFGRESRDQVNARVMADPRIKELCDQSNSPFDFKRMAYGGFKVLVDA